MAINVVSRRRKLENIQLEYPNAVIVDVTSKAHDDFVKLSPFYPHGGIPVPFSPNFTAQSVEGIWQGLKVFEGNDVDVSKFEITKMKGIKRTQRRFGRTLGHRNGVEGDNLLSYYDARIQVYLPSYEYMLKNKAYQIVQELKSISLSRTLILLDYETNGDLTNLRKPLSHAALVKAYIEGDFSFNALLA